MKGSNMMSRGALGTMAVLLSLAVLPALSQDVPRNYNQRQVEKRTSPQDREGIWVLDFQFKDPRVITVDIPGRGRRLVWYLLYQVSNNTGAPREFIPRFVWYCNDTDTAHHDVVLPRAVQAIQRIEDPTIPIHDSVSISNPDNPIPFVKQFDENNQRIAYPRYVTGVATWIVATPEEMKLAREKGRAAMPEYFKDYLDPRCTQFSIYVYGLSDGWTVVDGPDGKPIVRRKTLQLKFRRLGDEYTQHAGQIRYQGFDWIYATSDFPIPSQPAEPAAPQPPPAPPDKLGLHPGQDGLPR
jgi:hypothetical protein